MLNDVKQRLTKKKHSGDVSWYYEKKRIIGQHQSMYILYKIDTQQKHVRHY